MKTITKLFPAALLLAGAGSTLAAIHCVDLNSTNATPPYTNWSTAATNIQDAVDIAVAGDEIVVTNGTYATGGGQVIGPDNTFNRVAVDKPLSIRSVNGPQLTVIDGDLGVRCVYLANGASLSGFTLTNGLVFPSPYEFVSFAYGGGAYGGTLNNCTLTSNSVLVGGSGEFFIGASAGGGGAAFCTLNNCTLIGNSARGTNLYPYLGQITAQGGGSYACTLNNCTLSGNSVRAALFGGAPGFDLIIAQGGGAYQGTLNNCTLISNSISLYVRDSPFGGLSADGGGAYGGTLKNCILFGNTLGASCEDCGWDPRFVDLEGGNLRLQSNSPCINAGNNSYVTSATDLDGYPRIVGGSVDIGAYEFQSLDLLKFGVVSNQFGFVVTGQSNWVIVLEASSDFTNWTALTTNRLSGSPFPFRDPTPPNLPQRFYHARME